jgi:hypothetical protein
MTIHLELIAPSAGLFSLLVDPLIVGYAPLMKSAASLPTHGMHIIRPQS